jgi:hypothetical protein
MKMADPIVDPTIMPASGWQGHFLGRRRCGGAGYRPRL